MPIAFRKSRLTRRVSGTSGGNDPGIGGRCGLPAGGVITDFLGSGLNAVISYAGGDGNDVVLTVVSPNQPPTANADKYADELLDAYIFIEDADALYAEYAVRGVEFTRGLANMPWHSREFVVKDCDGRLLAFGANL